MSRRASNLVALRPDAIAGRLSQEWFSAAELAALKLPDFPASERAVQRYAKQSEWQTPASEGARWRIRQGRAGGGGPEYHWMLLPEAARIVVAKRFPPGEPEAADARDARVRDALADAYERLPETKKRAAERMAEALRQLRRLRWSGMSEAVAVESVCRIMDVKPSTLRSWVRLVRGAEEADWKYWLAPRHQGAPTREAPCHPDAWRHLLGVYLAKEAPTFEQSVRLTREAAAAQGWTLPSNRTLLRRIEALPREVVVLAREGVQQLAALYPAQRRDVRVFHATQAVNADGHTFDVFVRWEDGSVGRPVLVAFQDLYSRLILSHRIDRTENTHAVRLAFGDLVERYGIPEYAWLDNGRHFAAKWLTGGQATRYRFKVREDEPLGLFTQLGVEVHFTTPYHGQSKPIERAFRDFADDVAKHPSLRGAYTGRNPLAKPENYGAKAVPIDEFRALCAARIEAHNAREGRSGGVARGESYAQVFAASYATAPIRRATAEQRRLWLLAAEAVRVTDESTVELAGNRYYAPFLTRLAGTRVTLRFDPDALQQPLAVYGHDGAYLGEAEHLPGVGFNDTAAAAAHARAKRALLRNTREREALLGRMSQAEIAAAAPPPASAPVPPPPRVVRPVFGRGSAALAVQQDEPMAVSVEERLLAGIRALHAIPSARDD